MSNIDKQALRDSAESTINILENIAGFEPSDIDGDTVELRFETEDGFDTGCDVSIVDQCQKAADVVRALLDELEAKDKRIAELSQKADIYDMLRQDYELHGSLVEFVDWQAKRIAALEASHGNLREAMAGIHNTITAGGAYTPLAAIMNASKRAYEESAAAAAKGE
ncbi:ead/Ea22-like family protein [Enterobacter hormaechei]